MRDERLRIGCQTFTWEMLGAGWSGGPDALLGAVAAAGYEGIEITDVMIGHYADRPDAFASALDAHGLQLVAFAFASPSGFTVRDAVERDLETAARWIEFVRHFPSALISIGSATVVSEGAREEKFEIAAEFYNRAATLGAVAGVDVAVHPSSHHATLLFDRADYDRLFALLETDGIGWVPDTGHILRGHADLIDTLETYRDRIRYVHLKDVDRDGRWAMLGEGVCDTAAVVAVARGAPRFNGWLVLEEESERAAADPEAAVKADRETLIALGY